jgi:TRAP-type C4-dicarboxylate transport system substrate-binding protein
MNKRRQILMAAAAFSLGAPSVLRAKAAYKSEYRLSMASVPGTAWHKGSEQFANLVRERTQGRINIKLYPGASLVQGAQDRELVALRQGVIDMLTGTAFNWSSTVKDFALFGLPGLMPNERAVDAVIASEALNKDFYGIMRRAGLEPLASAEYGFLQLLNSKRRIAAPADVAGLKIRVVGSPMQQDIMSGVGANPTSMSWADAQVALSSKAIDGLFMPVEHILATKIYNLGLKHVTRWNLINELVHFTVAAPVFKSWTPEDQEIVRVAGREAAAESTRKVRELSNSHDLLTQNGMDFYAPTAAEQEAWLASVRKPYEKWKALTNPDLVTKLEQEIAKAA